MKFEGTVYVNIRKYYKDKESGEVLPTKTGISHARERAMGSFKRVGKGFYITNEEHLCTI